MNQTINQFITSLLAWATLINVLFSRGWIFIRIGGEPMKSWIKLNQEIAAIAVSAQQCLERKWANPVPRPGKWTKHWGSRWGNGEQSYLLWMLLWSTTGAKQRYKTWALSLKAKNREWGKEIKSTNKMMIVMTGTQLLRVVSIYSYLSVNPPIIYQRFIWLPKGPC